MYAKQHLSETGDYLNEEGKRVCLETADFVYYPGFTPEQLGWYEFPTEEECLSTWHLTYSPYIPESPLTAKENN